MPGPDVFVYTLTLVFLVGALAAYFPWRPARAGALTSDTVATEAAHTTPRPLPAGVKASLWLALIASLFAVAEAIWYLPGNAVTAAYFYGSPALAFLPALPWEARLDHLSAFFVLLIGAFSAIVAVYSFGALQARQYWGQWRRVAAGFNLFVWATLMVVVANDVFSLLAALEIMTLVFAFLSLFKHNLYLSPYHNLGLYSEEERQEKLKNARIAPQVYLIVSHTSTAFLLLALLVLAINANNLSFDRIIASAHRLGTGPANAVFLFALAGLGLRAGLVPGHFWVSLVHPSSPTTTHALSLGIAIKVAVYLMLRVFFQFLTPQPWWGYVVLFAAVLTAVINVWYAIASHDLKTALAYHSIENVGIITAGIGVGLVFRPVAGAQWVVALALAASMYHLLNHAVFKSLLYLCTGAIDNLANQTVEFERLGGLIKLYPWTSAAFLVGAVAISGFPPFNGFVSEWLSLQAIFQGLTQLQTGRTLTGIEHTLPSILIVACLALLVAAFALTAFCFVKIAGLTLLGASRSAAKERNLWRPGDAPRTMLAMMGLLAALCLALGLAPAPVMQLLGGVVGPLAGYVGELATPSALALTLASPQETHAGLIVVPGTMIAVGLACLALILSKLLNRRLAISRPAEPWNCGMPFVPARMQYTGAALSFSIRERLNFMNLGAAERSCDTGQPENLPTHIVLAHGSKHSQVVVEVFYASYDWLKSRVLIASEVVGNAIQNKDISRYLLYILLVNLFVLGLFLLIGRNP